MNITTITQWPSSIRWHITPIDETNTSGFPLDAIDLAFADDSNAAGTAPQMRQSPVLTDNGLGSGNLYTLAKGEMFAVLISVPSHTSGDRFQLGGHNHIATGINGTGRFENIALVKNSGISWAFGSVLGPFVSLALEFDDGELVPVACPTITRFFTFLISGFSPFPEYGNRLKPNIPVRMRGFYVGGYNNPVLPAGTKARVYLEGSNTILAEATHQVYNSFVNSNGLGIWHFDNDGFLALQAGKVYRIVARAGASASSFIGNYEYVSSAMREAEWEIDGIEFQATTRVSETGSADSWTERPLEVAQVFPIIDAFDPFKQPRFRLQGVRDFVRRIKGERI